ncbi:MAG TPA: hypothetical protein VN180_12540 [Acidimicrobiia bacterium]|nr:hypothetical protein [Acidimicrobiia bacterium]
MGDALAVPPPPPAPPVEEVVPRPVLPPPRTPVRATRGPRPSSSPSGPLLPDAPALFPWLARHFSPGEATLWVGARSAIEPMLETLYAGSALADGRLSLLEGANRFHPYRIGEQGRALGVDPGQVLERIRLARAFTAYQLVALADGWSAEARRHRPTLLVAHELSELFFTEEVPAEERVPLLTHVASALEKIVRRTGLPLLVTAADGFARFPGLKEHGPRLFDMVRFRTGSGSVTLEALRDASRLSLVPRAPGQLGLDAFAPPDREEVIAWDARPRRTARRSRSG